MSLIWRQMAGIMVTSSAIVLIAMSRSTGLSTATRIVTFFSTGTVSYTVVLTVLHTGTCLKMVQGLPVHGSTDSTASVFRYVICCSHSRGLSSVAMTVWVSVL